MRRILQACSVPVGVVLAAALAIAAHGCAGRPGRRAPSPAPARWQSQGSTLGSDLLRAPRGITIPPSSLGIDLVKYPGGKAPGAVERATLPAQPE